MKHARPDYNRIQDPAGLIPADEPVFLLRAQDRLAPIVIRKWADLVENSFGSPEIVNLARLHAAAMEEWQSANGSKIPDLSTLAGDAAPANPLKITSVTVRRLKTLPGHNHVAIEATAAVMNTDNPSATRADLDLWVQAEIQGPSVDDLRRQRDTLEWEVKSLEREKERLRAQVDALRLEISRAPAHTREPLQLVGEQG